VEFVALLGVDHDDDACIGVEGVDHDVFVATGVGTAVEEVLVCALSSDTDAESPVVLWGEHGVGEVLGDDGVGFALMCVLDGDSEFGDVGGCGPEAGGGEFWVDKPAVRVWLSLLVVGKTGVFWVLVEGAVSHLEWLEDGLMEVVLEAGAGGVFYELLEDGVATA